MEKRLKCYLTYVETVKWDTLTVEEREKWKKELLTQISFFQHERLVHLIVTVLFAALTVFGVLLLVLEQSLGFCMLELLFWVLLVPYVRHYYILENGVQKLYRYYDGCSQTYFMEESKGK